MLLKPSTENGDDDDGKQKTKKQKGIKKSKKNAEHHAEALNDVDDDALDMDELSVSLLQIFVFFFLPLKK